MLFLKRDVTATIKVPAAQAVAVDAALKTILANLSADELILVAEALKNPSLKQTALTFLRQS